MNSTRAVALGCFFEGPGHRGCLGGELQIVLAARFPAKTHLIRHDVRRRAALDDADIGGRFRVNTPQRHRCDGLAGHPDRVDAFLRFAACMGFLSEDRDAQGILAGRAGHDRADRAARIQDVPAPGKQLALVQQLCPVQASLLAHADDHLQGRMGARCSGRPCGGRRLCGGGRVFVKRPDDLQDDRHP